MQVKSLLTINQKSIILEKKLAPGPEASTGFYGIQKTGMAWDRGRGPGHHKMWRAVVLRNQFSLQVLMIA